jgi:hypothetical protein
MESRSLVGQGFASSTEPFLAFFPVSRQCKWTAVSLRFSGFHRRFVRVAGHFCRPTNHIPGMRLAEPCRVLTVFQRLGDDQRERAIKNDEPQPLTIHIPFI